MYLIYMHAVNEIDQITEMEDRWGPYHLINLTIRAIMSVRCIKNIYSLSISYPHDESFTSGDKEEVQCKNPITFHLVGTVSFRIQKRDIVLRTSYLIIHLRGFFTFANKQTPASDLHTKTKTYHVMEIRWTLRCHLSFTVKLIVLC